MNPTRVLRLTHSLAVTGGICLAALMVSAPSTAEAKRRVPFEKLGEKSKEKLEKWALEQVNKAQIAICYRDRMGRQMNSVVQPELTFARCKDGFTGVGNTCVQNCPGGFRDIGLACVKLENYVRSTYSWRPGDALFSLSGAGARCHHDNPQGCDTVANNTMLPRCRAGFYPVANGCSQECPPGMTDTGVACTKEVHGRQGEMKINCPPGQDNYLGTCWNRCPEGFGISAVNPAMCWQSCPSTQPYDCGTACALNRSECTDKIAQTSINAADVLSTFGGLIATGGSANAAKAGFKVALRQAAKSLVKNAAKQLAKGVLKSMAKDAVADIAHEYFSPSFSGR